MKYSIVEALEELEISKAKLYNLFKLLQIQTHKKGRKSYLTSESLSLIKEYMRSEEESRHKIHIETPEREKSLDSSLDSLDSLKQAHTDEIERLRKGYEIQQNSLQERLDQKEQETKELAITLGQWQGRAKTLEEQHIKLLEAQVIVEKENIEDAEVVEKKRSFWVKIFRRK